MFVTLILLLTLGVPAIGFIAAGVLLVRNRMSESVATVGGVLGVLATSFGTLLAFIAVYAFIMLLMGNVVTVVSVEEFG